MTGVSILELLRSHVGHRVLVIEQPTGTAIGVKCTSTTCDGYGRILDLSSAFGLRPGTNRPTSTPTKPARRDHPTKAEECPAHTGEFRDNCRCCAGEAKARPDHIPPAPRGIRTGADPTTVPEVAATRARLEELARTREARQRAAEQARLTDPERTVDAADPPPGGGDQ